uniref:Granulins domain-containing protein n=1 Tax=Callorhinchus milii TaxID=7868 RepID=A0A4W3J9A7_CALMI
SFPFALLLNDSSCHNFFPICSKPYYIQFNSGRSVTYCDNLHYCSAENTCCRLPSGSWGCCPIPSATCCNDGVHCCPHGMNCDAENSFCTTDSIRIPWFNKKPALIATDVVNSVGRDSSVVNCDKTYFCKDGLTCCPTAMGRWGSLCNAGIEIFRKKSMW